MRILHRQFNELKLTMIKITEVDAIGWARYIMFTRTRHRNTSILINWAGKMFKLEVKKKKENKWRNKGYKNVSQYWTQSPTRDTGLWRTKSIN